MAFPSNCSKTGAWIRKNHGCPCPTWVAGRTFISRAVFLRLGFVARAHVLSHIPRDAPAQVTKILALGLDAAKNADQANLCGRTIVAADPVVAHAHMPGVGRGAQAQAEDGVATIRIGADKGQ